MNATHITTPNRQSPSPALISLLEAAEDAACDFSTDASSVLRPLVHAAIKQEQQSAAISPTTPEASDDLEALISSLGWNSDNASFSGPIDPRALSSRLKASMLSDLTLVGEGSYSVVYRAHNRLNGSTVTLKKLRLDGSAEGLPATAVREMSLLRELSGCPHVVKLLDVLCDTSRVYLILEHLDMDLHEYLHSSHLIHSNIPTTTTTASSSSPSSTQQHQLPIRDARFVKSIMNQILLGVAAAHAHRVIHRDLKPQNILLDRSTCQIKIADFGLSRTFQPSNSQTNRRTMTREVVTLLYRAPELLLGCVKYSTAVDMWSAGCVFAELLLGRPLFAGDSEIGQLYQIFQLRGTPDNEIWPGVTSLPEWQPLFPLWRAQDLTQVIQRGGCIGMCSHDVDGADVTCKVVEVSAAGIDLLSRMLSLDPEKRPTASQALDHPYFMEL